MKANSERIKRMEKVEQAGRETRTYGEEIPKHQQNENFIVCDLKKIKLVSSFSFKILNIFSKLTILELLIVSVIVH